MKKIIIVIGIVVVVIIVDYVVQKVTAPAICGVASAFLLPDKCAGGCPVGTAPPCAATATAPYGPGGILGTQPTACSCTVLPPPAGTGGGTIGGSSVAPVTGGTVTNPN